MKERLNSLLSEVGESFDYLRSDVRNLGRYLAELEELIEGYRAFAASVTLSTSGDRKARGKLLKKTCKVLGPPPNEQHGKLTERWLLSNLGDYRLLVSLIEQDISLYRIPFVLSKQAESL